MIVTLAALVLAAGAADAPGEMRVWRREAE